jgi:hypothetical protein
MFNRQHMLVIDGKYSSEDGMSTRRSIRSILGRRCRASSISSEEIVQRIVGRFNRQSELVIDGRIRVCIDGKNNDGKDQHDHQRSDNGRGGASVIIGPHPESPMTIRYEFRQEEHAEEEDRS